MNKSAIYFWRKKRATAIPGTIFGENGMFNDVRENEKYEECLHRIVIVKDWLLVSESGNAFEKKKNLRKMFKIESFIFQ